MLVEKIMYYRNVNGKNSPRKNNSGKMFTNICLQWSYKDDSMRAMI